ncbi:LEAF RUST 10 DISEASE-RESISTANCE LOCUS RECEPTOR-LIKE PROTEIN KINASE-like 2.1 isoform X2 [Salvia hispanica]|uniref:LEAF RUST 10 DISEASE-RESISTANCE LOCUS RECEPTOR-LIKE PROTEIN KINASE-like 2.1 isoform X2 n=1 Tax=Salvia hispanica TaxID=49212 RepID=UPI0020091C99|nr:LEAF RUST 10 DISEASE-RESISTANCE LOCUS RECEPTOR-LIKE PROTEIN KINASE-like 2.1 isoform X2 [Salvia hispanica]
MLITTHQNLITSSLFSILFLSLHSLFESCDAKCSPSSCGIIPNISPPFRLKGHPKNCGDPRFELSCENNVAYFSLHSHKYYVQEIYYRDEPTIRVVDASINKDDICSFPPFSIYAYNFTYHNPNRLRYLKSIYSSNTPLNFISCPNPLRNTSLYTDITNQCASNSSHHHRYAYVKVGSMMASEVPYACGVDLIAMTSWYDFEPLKNVSLSEIHEVLLYGFELGTCLWPCDSHDSSIIKWCLLCAAVSPPVFTLCGFAAVALLLCLITSTILLSTESSIYNKSYPSFPMLNQQSVLIIGFITLFARIIIFPLVWWFLIYKFRRRRLSEYNTIESFLQSDNKLSPIRYSYSAIKRMTRGFQEKLGEGGYGCVYKGKLRSGHHVAVKMLGKSGGNGQDFMNEIATIGRVHHINVVQLVGYCAQGSKRALVFDFMPNGSLKKYLFNREKMNSLNWDTKFDIAVGIARGIDYLHQGCDIQILHFDIKPHNILLDHNFAPKISDFGLAKSCSVEKEAVTLTAARGTIGYVAPELIHRGIGVVSSKADVYSFGMLLMEMVGFNRELRKNSDDSTKYFPNWIYDHIKQGKEIEIAEENISNDENESVRKMTIVALWCILMSPDDRPSMNQVLQMLEADVKHLQIPEVRSSQSTQVAGNGEDGSWLTDATDSASLLHHDNASSFEITIA